MTRYFLSLLFTLLAFSSYASGPATYSEALDYIEERTGHNPCQYYLDQEVIFQCGPKGYLVDYGNYYCNRFFEIGYKNMSPTGRDWMLKTLSCLQESLEKNATLNSSKDCTELKDSAMKEHVQCYLSSGFCHLEARDFIAIKMVVKSKDLFLNQNMKIINEVFKQCF